MKHPRRDIIPLGLPGLAGTPALISTVQQLVMGSPDLMSHSARTLHCIRLCFYPHIFYLYLQLCHSASEKKLAPRKFFFSSFVPTREGERVADTFSSPRGFSLSDGLRGRQKKQEGESPLGGSSPPCMMGGDVILYRVCVCACVDVCGCVGVRACVRA